MVDLRDRLSGNRRGEFFGAEQPREVAAVVAERLALTGSSGRQRVSADLSKRALMLTRAAS